MGFGFFFTGSLLSFGGGGGAAGSLGLADPFGRPRGRFGAGGLSDFSSGSSSIFSSDSFSSGIFSGISSEFPGIISGILATGFVLGSALGPILGSIIWVYGGYDSVIFIAILIPVLAIISIIGAWKFKS